jgi:hypothetical protein
MARATPQLKSLKVNKQLLLAESELNRAQLLQELSCFRGEIQRLENQLEMVVSLIASAAKISRTVSAIGHAFTHRGRGKSESSSWISSLLSGARKGAILWAALQSHMK